MKRSENFNFNSVSKKPKIEEDIWGGDIDIDEIDKCISLASQKVNESLSNNNVTGYDTFELKADVCSTQAFKAPFPAAVPSTSKQVFNTKKDPVFNSSYNNFKNHTNFVSTQNVCNGMKENKFNISTDSARTVITDNFTAKEYQRKLIQDVKRIEEQYKKLLEKCETKDGEISILRSKLTQAEKVISCEKLQNLKQMETIQHKCNEKYQVVVKEKDKARDELERKVIEIMNLKEKVQELKGYRPDLNDSLNLSQFKTSQFMSNSFVKRRNSTSSPSITKRIAQVQTDAGNSKIIIENTKYPLQKLIPEIYFKKYNSKNDPIIKLKNCVINEDLKKNYQNEYFIYFDLPVKDKITLSTDFFVTELVSLMNRTITQLNYRTIVPDVNKIVLVTRELLLSTLDKLKKLEKNLSNEDLRFLNSEYLRIENNCIDMDSCIFSPIPWNENELAIELRRSIAVLSALTIHNKYLAECLTGKHDLELSKTQYETFLRPTEENTAINPTNTEEILNLNNLNISENPEEVKIIKCDILNLVLETVMIIGKTRRSIEFCGFLASVLSLLTSLLHHKNLLDECNVLIHSIFQQVLFTPVSTQVLRYLLKTLEQMVLHENIVILLCKNSESSTIRREKYCIMFTEKTCTFQIIANILERHQKDVYIAWSLLNFLHQVLMLDASWMYEQDQTCECLFKVCTTAMGVLYGTMQIFLSNKLKFNEAELCNYRNIYRTGLMLISVLADRSSNAMFAWREAFSQYLHWLKFIRDHEDILQLKHDHVLALQTLDDFEEDIEEDKGLSDTSEVIFKNHLKYLFKPGF